MGLPRPRLVYTVEEYLAIDRASEERFEYLDGEIFVMAAESSEHGDISVNIVAALHQQLKGTPCRARTKDTKVRSGPTPTTGRNTYGMYSYPDIVVICGELDYIDEFDDVIVNPTVIIEVLSPSTEEFDRGEKQKRYTTWNTTLQEYLLVSQVRPKIEQFIRQADGSWKPVVREGLTAIATLGSIKCVLNLVDVYDRVKFSE